MRFAFYTLGCKTNQYETQAMEQLLTELGHEIGQFDQPCDGYIINTCSVTAVADTFPSLIIIVLLQLFKTSFILCVTKIIVFPCFFSCSNFLKHFN